MGLRILPSASAVDMIYVSNPSEGYQGTVHVDKQHFMMLVLTGYKTVWVAPAPPMSLADFSSTRFSFSSHGYQYVITSPGELMNFAVDHMALTKDPWRRITLGAGQALHLPRGWPHRVDSAARTISISLVVKELS